MSGSAQLNGSSDLSTFSRRWARESSDGVQEVGNVCVGTVVIIILVLALLHRRNRVRGHKTGFDFSGVEEHTRKK